MLDYRNDDGGRVLNYGTIEELTEQLDDVTKLYVDALTGCVDSMVEFISLTRIPPSGAVRLSDYMRIAGSMLEHRDEVIQDSFDGDVWTAEELLDACISVAVSLKDLHEAVEADKRTKGDRPTYLHGEIDDLIAASVIGLINRYLHPVGTKLDEICDEQEQWEG